MGVNENGLGDLDPVVLSDKLRMVSAAGNSKQSFISALKTLFDTYYPAAGTYIKPDGTVAFAADQSMGGNKLTSLGVGTAPADAVILSQINPKISAHDPAGSCIILDDDGYTHIINSATGTVALPTLADNYNRLLTIERDVAGSSTGLIIDGEGAETINGSATYVLYGYGASVTLFASQAAGEWVVVAIGESRVEGYVPTYGATGSMTFTSVTTLSARWFQSGSQINVTVSARGTTGGTASTYLTATPPVNPSASYANGDIVGSGTCDGGGGQISGLPLWFASGTIGVKKYDASNYGLGTNRLLGYEARFRAF